MLQNHVTLYLESLRAANASPATIKAYSHALEEFMQFVGQETDARDVDVQVIRAHIHRLAAKGLSPVSRNHAMRVLKTFGKFLVEERIVEENVFALASPAKCPSRLISPPTVETVTALLDGKMSAPSRGDGRYKRPELLIEFSKARDRALLELLYGTGVRVHEAAGVMMEDLRGDGTILIHGKGDKERLVPVGGPLRRALDAYMHTRRRVLRKFKRQSSVLFFSVSNHTKDRMPVALDVRSVHRILTAACRANGLAALHPHSLRHACATHMLDNGAPLTALKELLGHAKLSTTANYAFVSTALMQKTYNAAHPHAQSTIDSVRSE
jgi:integrase/recombinase XerD